VFPAIVAVALPEETSEPDAQAVLDACSQAYLDGDCTPSSDSQTQTKFIAEVRWLDETHAEVSVRFVEGEQRSAARSLEFQPGDVAAERYRSLGFAAGSLAGTLAELERIQAEAKAQEAAAEEDHVAPAEPLDAAPLEPPPAVRREEVQTLKDVYRLGLTLGTGMDAARVGLSAGARGVWSNRWLLDAQTSFGSQSSNADGIEALFVNGFIGIGVEGAVGPITADAMLGPALQWQRAKRATTSTAGSVFSWGGELALGAHYSKAPIAPFVEFRGGLFQETEITLSEDEVNSFGPVQLQGIIGVSITRGDE
jgi:hypothetical protein